MAKKGGSFWDNPFGGMFDFNRDGREDFGEQWLAFKIFEECTKNDNSSDSDFFASPGRRNSYVGFNADDEPDFLDDSYDDVVDHDWRLFCEDGSDVGVDPEDFDSRKSTRKL